MIFTLLFLFSNYVFCFSLYNNHIGKFSKTLSIRLKNDNGASDELSNIHSSLSVPRTQTQFTTRQNSKLLRKSLLFTAASMGLFIKPKLSHSTGLSCSCKGWKNDCRCLVDNVDAADSPWYDPRNERIFDTNKKSYLPPRAEVYLKHVLKDRHVVCVGEVHSNPCHHKVQFDVVKSLSTMVPTSKLAIGLECFYRQHQAALDRYVFQHRDFSTLKLETNWDYTWGFDINYYAKIFHYASLNGIRLIGLNIPLSVARLVRDNGLDGIPSDLRALMPKDIDLNDLSHRHNFMDSIMASGHIAHNSKSLDRLYEVQVLWDEYMAESASNYLNSEPPGTVLCVMAGQTHVSGRTGIPNRISKRTNKQPFVIVPKQVSWSPESGLPDIGVPPSEQECDWAWFTEREIGYI